MPAGTIAAIVTIATVVGAVASGLAAHLVARRNASGRVSTSEASVLWQQSQDMRAMMMSEKVKAEEQRDMLIAAYSQQLLPVLTAVKTIVGDLAAAVAVNSRSIHAIEIAVTGGGEHAEAEAPKGAPKPGRGPGALPGHAGAARQGR